MIKKIILSILLVYLNRASGELRAVKSQAKLPTGRTLMSIVYDGEDTIYLHGGWQTKLGRTELMTYTLSSDSIVAVDTKLKVWTGTLARDSKGGLYQIGGFDGNTNKAYKAISKYDPGAKKWVGFATLPEEQRLNGLVQPGPDEAYLVGGFQTGAVIKVNLQDASVTPHGNIEEMKNAFASAAVWDGKNALVFKTLTNQNTWMFKYDVGQKKYNVVSRRIPPLKVPAAVWDGSKVYLVGGAVAKKKMTDGLYEVDPETGNWTFVPVGDFPAQGKQLYGPSAVYVEKQHRIYIFGGNAAGDGVDGIWWIDLEKEEGEMTTTEEPPHPPPGLETPEPEPTTEEEPPPELTTEPPTDRPEPPPTRLEPPPGATTTEGPEGEFDCQGKGESIHSHPSMCNVFIVCRNGVKEEHTCPEPLLFDPKALTCTIPSHVECGVHCSGKDVGVYPHPYDCRLFLGCDGESTAIYQCPGDLLFDPVKRWCYFSDLVECKNQRR